MNLNMKKTILIAATLFICSHFQAQIVKGTKSVGLGLSFNKGKNDDLESTLSSVTKSYGFSFSPSFNYFIKDNFSIGGYIGTGFGKSSANYTYLDYPMSEVYQINENKTNFYRTGINGVYYKKMLEKLYFFGEVSLSYSYYYRTESSIMQDQYAVSHNFHSYITNAITFNLSPSITYFITPKLGINLKMTPLFFQFQNSLNKMNQTLVYQNSPENNVSNNQTISQNSFRKNAWFSKPSISVNYFF